MPESLEQLFATGTYSRPTIVREFMTLKKHGRPFLLVPTDRLKAARALTLYPAQRGTARFVRALLSGILNTRLPLPLKKMILEISPDDSFARFLKIQSGMRSLPDFAILMGNPNVAGRRHVILLFDPNSKPTVVIKVGAGPAAIELVEHERAFLRSAPGNAQGIPKLRGHYDAPNLKAVALDFVEGDSPSPYDYATECFCKTLESWIESSRTIELEKTYSWAQLIERCHDAPLFQAVQKRVAGKLVRPVIQHGDFAPWNIKVSPRNSTWHVLDWERGQREGIPGWDWFHYIVQSSILVLRQTAQRTVDSMELLFSSDPFGAYAAKTGIAGIERELLLMYLLHSIEVLRPAEGADRLRSLLNYLSQSEFND